MPSRRPTQKPPPKRSQPPQIPTPRSPPRHQPHASTSRLPAHAPPSPDLTQPRTSTRLSKKRKLEETKPDSSSGSDNEGSHFEPGHSDTESSVSVPQPTLAPPKKRHDPQQRHDPQPTPTQTDANTATNNTSHANRITVENYEDCDLDMSELDELLASKDRKTGNRLPADVAQELKNLQFRYRRAKKLMALAGHCSENTVNTFLYVHPFLQHPPKYYLTNHTF